MENMIRGVATKRVGADGYIVLIDSFDLSNWLRSEHPSLSPAEVKFAHSIADHIDSYALQILNNELDNEK